MLMYLKHTSNLLNNGCIFNDAPITFFLRIVLLKALVINVFFGAVLKRRPIVLFTTLKFCDVSNNCGGTVLRNSELKKDCNERR